jgi:hypothetical protein
MDRAPARGSNRGFERLATLRPWLGDDGLVTRYG